VLRPGKQDSCSERDIGQIFAPRPPWGRRVRGASGIRGALGRGGALERGRLGGRGRRKPELQLEASAATELPNPALLRAPASRAALRPPRGSARGPGSWGGS
jgi:hypothetical protein